jgi:hypothetical protein
LIERRLRPNLGRRKLDRLTAADLDAYYLRLERERLSPASICQMPAPGGEVAMDRVEPSP